MIEPGITSSTHAAYAERSTPTLGPVTVPNFLMVGCQRCGTTWVDAALREHPQIYLPPQKQTYFFDDHYDRGFDWYLGNFKAVGPHHVAVGEVATGYCLPHAIPRLAKHLPDVKLFMTMRNPVERVYSSFLSSQAEESWKDFDHYVTSHPEVLERGRYAEQIEILLSHYDRSRLLLLFYDDLVADDRKYLRRILKFVGVDEEFQTSQFGKISNSTTLPRLRRVMYSAGLRPLLRTMSGSPLGNAFRRAKKVWMSKGKRRMDPRVRAKLTEYYRPWNDRLSGLTGRDLSCWN
jgi:hypothetical protein